MSGFHDDLRGFRKIDKEIIEFSRGNRGGRRRMAIPNEEEFAEREAKLSELEQRIDKEKTSSNSEVKGILADHMLQIIDGMKAQVKESKSQPHRYLHGLLYGIESISQPRDRERNEDNEESRLERTKEMLSKGGDLIKAVENLCSNVPASSRRMVIDSLERIQGQADTAKDKLKDVFSKASDSDLNNLVASLNDIAKLAADIKDQVKTLPEAKATEESFTYGENLKRIYDVDLDELLSWYEDEVEKCNKKVFDMAKELDPNRHPFEILDQDLPACDSAESMFALLRDCVALAREKCQQWVTLPEGEECGVKPVPESIKDFYPWGGYGYEGNVLNGDLKGHVFLNQYNYATITRGWIYMNAIYECYAGHHVHTVKTAAQNMPLTFKIGRAVPLSEGVCMRSETLMQDIYGDKTYPLFTAYRRLHTAVRIMADLAIFQFNQGEEAAVELYMKYLGLARHVAQGQVNSQMRTPGYFTTYYYGLQKLESMQKECGWNDKDYTELIFSSGRFSLDLLPRLIKLNPEERHLLFHNFYPEDER